MPKISIYYHGTLSNLSKDLQILLPDYSWSIWGTNSHGAPGIKQDGFNVEFHKKHHELRFFYLTSGITKASNLTMKGTADLVKSFAQTLIISPKFSDSTCSENGCKKEKQKRKNKASEV